MHRGPWTKSFSTSKQNDQLTKCFPIWLQFLALRNTISVYLCLYPPMILSEALYIATIVSPSVAEETRLASAAVFFSSLMWDHQLTACKFLVMRLLCVCWNLELKKTHLMDHITARPTHQFREREYTLPAWIKLGLSIWRDVLRTLESTCTPADSFTFPVKWQPKLRNASLKPFVVASWKDIQDVS